MKTLKLRLEPAGISRFKMLTYESVGVSLRQLLSEGLHPDGYGEKGRHCRTTGIRQALKDRMNAPEMKIPGLEEHGHCGDVELGSYSYYSDEEAKTDACGALEQIGDRILFAENLTFKELFEVAKALVEKIWSHTLARKLLTGAFYSFNDQRRFLKSKDPKVKLCSRSDIDNYDLSTILSPKDFFREELLLIREGMPGALNFRRESFLNNITTPEGYLCLGAKVKHFAIMIRDNNIYLKYNCTPKDSVVEFIPSFEESTGLEEQRRAFARAVSSRYGNGTRYIFTCSVESVEEMLQEGAEIHFPDLNYVESGVQRLEPVSTAAVDSGVRIPVFTIGSPVTDVAGNATLKTILCEHGEKMSGVKEELVERMTDLCAKLYEQAKPVLDAFFQSRYIRVDGCYRGGKGHSRFPVKFRSNGKEETSLHDNLLVMYAIRHMRGDRILDRDHNNNTYSTRDLAKAVIAKDVSLSGVFVKVISPQD